MTAKTEARINKINDRRENDTRQVKMKIIYRRFEAGRRKRWIMRRRMRSKKRGRKMEREKMTAKTTMLRGKKRKG